MSQLPMEAWCMIGAVAVAAVLAMLHSLALCYREQTKVHDLRVRVYELRKQYKARMANLAAAEDCDVIPLTERPRPLAEEAAKKAA